MLDLMDGYRQKLGVEPLHVVERRHIEKVLDACGGNRCTAADLLGIARSTLYRRLAEYRGTHYAGKRQPPPPPKPTVHLPPLPPMAATETDRQRVEAAIEECGGSLKDAAQLLGMKAHHVANLMRRWHRDNEARIKRAAPNEGISADEIEVMLRRRTVTEHAERCGFSTVTAYKMIDEACALAGLRRYRNWLFLA